MRVKVIGAGLAGCEAAWFLANKGVKVTLIEQKPIMKSPAHHIDSFAELVCSNSLKAERIGSAGGLLKAEMQLFNSICIKAANKCKVPAGGALAVDRQLFSEYVTELLLSNDNITVEHKIMQEVSDECPVIIATGPLTDGDLAASISKLCGDYLSFHDAAAPIISADSIDLDFAFVQSRYDKGDGDYINCPMDKQQYEQFYQELVSAQTVELKSFEKNFKVYEGCMPIEVMAKRGMETMRFGPLKPVGLTNPKTGYRPWAVLQLRKENSDGTMYNMVGFQTNLKFPEQKRVFSLIPALSKAEFVRFGVMHRNSFINSPKLLTAGYKLKNCNNIYFAGQITGVEGYMESASSGILAAINVFRQLCGLQPLILPKTTMMGALSHYISDQTVKNFQPMGASFGLVPPSDKVIKNKAERYLYLANRALADLEEVIKGSDINEL